MEADWRNWEILTWGRPYPTSIPTETLLCFINGEKRALDPRADFLILLQGIFAFPRGPVVPPVTYIYKAKMSAARGYFDRKRNF